jgi:hypothetical protein
MFHRPLGIVTKYLIEVTDLDFDISHGRPPDDAPEDAVHIPEIHGQR